jgi:hypothetical protein
MYPYSPTQLLLPLKGWLGDKHLPLGSPALASTGASYGFVQYIPASSTKALFPPAIVSSHSSHTCKCAKVNPNTRRKHKSFLHKARICGIPYSHATQARPQIILSQQYIWRLRAARTWHHHFRLHGIDFGTRQMPS